MKKQDKIQDSPEFQYYKDDFENFKKGMEDDKEYADLKIPDEWEQDFAKTIDDTLDGNKRRNKIIKRIVGVAAAVVLVVILGNLTSESVSGENLLEMFINRLFVGEKQYDIYGNYTDVEFGEDDNQEVVFFSSETIEEVNKQLREEIKAPIFYLLYIPDGFTVEEGSYDKKFRIINMKLINESGEYIYIFQQKQIDETASGIMSENTVDSRDDSFAISNNILNKPIQIFESLQDSSFMFHVKEKNDMLTVDALISKEECIKIAENIDYY